MWSWSCETTWSDDGIKVTVATIIIKIGFLGKRGCVCPCVHGCCIHSWPCAGDTALCKMFSAPALGVTVPVLECIFCEPLASPTRSRPLLFLRKAKPVNSLKFVSRMFLSEIFQPLSTDAAGAQSAAPTKSLEFSE